MLRGVCYRARAGGLALVGSEHPDALLLLVEEGADEVARDDVVSGLGSSSHLTLLSDEHAEAVEQLGEDLLGVADVVRLLDGSDLEVLAEAVLRRSAQLQETLGDLVYMLGSAVVVGLELCVQGEAVLVPLPQLRPWSGQCQ